MSHQTSVLMLARDLDIACPKSPRWFQRMEQTGWWFVLPRMLCVLAGRHCHKNSNDCGCKDKTTQINTKAFIPSLKRVLVSRDLVGVDCESTLIRWCVAVREIASVVRAIGYTARTRWRVGEYGLVGSIFGNLGILQDL